MARPLCVLFAFLFLSGWAAPEKRPLETKDIELEPFSAINDCLPFNVKVEPSKAKDEYTVTIEGEKALLKAVDANVRKGVLSLGLKRGFETERVIKVTVKMPRDALDTIVKTSTSVLAVAPGLKAEELTIMTSGVAAVRVFDADVDDLVVEAEGSSIIFADGRIEQARLDVDGTAKAYVYGLTSKAEVHANAIGRVFIDADNKNVEVDGRVEGLGRVFLTKGSCTVEGTFFRSGCEDVTVNELPAFEAAFSCGLIVDGKIVCDRRGSGGTYTSSRVGQTTGSTFASASAGSSGSSSAKTSASASSSSSGGGTAFTRTSTSSSSSSAASGDHQFESVVSAEGDGGAVAVATTQCLDEDIEMFAQS